MMKDLMLLVMFVAGAALTAGPVEAQGTQQFSAGNISLNFNVEMTMEQVNAVVGWRPNSAEQMTCGSSTPSPWPCRVWTYGFAGNGLIVRFHQNDDGSWHVNDWQLF